MIATRADHVAGGVELLLDAARRHGVGAHVWNVGSDVGLAVGAGVGTVADGTAVSVVGADVSSSSSGPHSCGSAPTLESRVMR